MGHKACPFCENNLKGFRMRTLSNGLNDYTQVRVMDEPGVGGANHRYEIAPVTDKEVEDFRCLVNFQNGPIKEAGVNGVTNEDLIAIVIDRLEGFQSGDFACKFNCDALKDLKDALLHLNGRTAERETRGVEGINAK